jgi:hypothetical protein
MAREAGGWATHRRLHIGAWGASGGGLPLATDADIRARFTRFREGRVSRSDEASDPDHGSE